ncbi:hypothetical protein SAMN05421863_103020 [Nitrosomonas communis]|uniref:Uncharacterized protein n=1 Tax=Nitrosomonas communis TaxID=44574 RepID=A0A1I4R4Q7_9PROT|nr:hypothetical protein SAMN05421863_103020 [Nitrosomonas communis]
MIFYAVLAAPRLQMLTRSMLTAFHFLRNHVLVDQQARLDQQLFYHSVCM